jgi:RHS repeat-associated protein
MQMQLSSGTQIPDGILADFALRNEKPRLGVPSRNPALHQGIDASNSTIVLGLQSTAALNRIGSRSTGKERDTESGLDNFGARYYGSSMGRFMSPDPSGLYFADPTNPQSLNLYSYAQNNPLKNIDPDGLRCVWDDGSFDAEDDKQTGNQGSCESQGGTWHDPNTYAKGADWASTNSDGTLQLHGAAPSESVTVTGTATGYVGDAAVWFGGYINDVGLAYTNATNLITGGRQVPYDRFFGTHYCGPGGSGQPNGTLDKACKVHDECFAAAGLDASVNVGTSTAALSPTQAAAAQKCNQGLYNAARANPGKTGSSSLRLWLTQSVSTPFGGYVLYPGTQAKTW